MAAPEKYGRRRAMIASRNALAWDALAWDALAWDALAWDALAWDTASWSGLLLRICSSAERDHLSRT
jgi:hypothetical protein